MSQHFSPVRSTKTGGHDMQHVLRYAMYATIATMFSALLAASASAQNAPVAPARFCPSPSDSQATDGTAPAAPSIGAGMGALGRRNFPQAYANLRPLADMGNVEAERDIGIVLRQSCGPSDKSAAVSWFQKAADAGDVEASAELGNMYMFGDGVAQDDAGAAKLLALAATAGHLIAQTNLGELYFTGRGVAQDRYQGVVWSVRAGERGEPVALIHIGREYANGLALPKDDDKALFFMTVGFQRLPPARRNQFAPGLQALARQMSIVQVNTITQTAQKWAPAQGSLSAVLADANAQRGQCQTSDAAGQARDEDARLCGAGSTSPDVSIRSCTALIESGRE